MKVALFLEGSPGHEKQSLAIVEELRNVADVEVKSFTVAKSSPIQRLAQLNRLLLLPDGGCEYGCPDVDILLGTGTSTHFPMLACKKKYGIPAIVCMSPGKLVRPYFDLCFVPRHDGLMQKDNIFITDGPPVYSDCGDTEKDPLRGLILIGGADPAVYLWDEELLAMQVEKILSRERDVKWNISTSPRTPESTAERLQAICSTNENAKFYHFRDTRRGWVEQEYARSTYSWVTVDSMSMVYEALTMGCLVGLLPLQWKKDNKFKRSMNSLVERKIAMPFAHWQAGEEMIPSPKPFNEAKRCAQEIVSRWPLNK